ncbi:MAG TPA: LptE family protein [Verrucomicrobiae bacterium]|nr:LptE family protein [Verrucomicrobiae bacterium]
MKTGNATTRLVLFNFLFAILVAVLAGCAGYRPGPVNGQIAGDKTIEVQPFNNQTLQPRLGDAVTQALRERLQADGTYRLVTGEPGDVVVSGIIINYARQPLSYLNTDVATPQNYRVSIIAHVVVRERGSGKLLFSKNISGSTLVNVGVDLQDGERQAMPVAAEDLARNVAELVTEGAWK